MRHSRQDLPADLDSVVERLHAHRAELSPLELDRIKLESKGRAAGKPRFNHKREKEVTLKTRTSILAVLVSGIVFSGGGVALGVSGLAGSDSAGNSQYQVAVGGVEKTNTPGPIVAGATATRPAAGEQGATSPVQVAQPTAQQSLDSNGSLPFTGYAAIPVLLFGLALLGAGLVMRRRSMDPQRP